MYVGFMNFEKVYDRGNKEALWKALRKCDMSGKLLTVLGVCEVTV